MIVVGISFASYYGDHMVLQQQPRRAQVWGYADTEGSVITVTLGGIPTATVNTTVVYNEGLGRNVWKVLLPPLPPSGPHTTHTLQAKGKDGTSVLLEDVLFGPFYQLYSFKTLMVGPYITSIAQNLDFLSFFHFFSHQKLTMFFWVFWF